jgi:hypothetical protein
MSQEQAKQFIDQATQSLQSGQFQQALELLDQAIALNPNDSESHVLRGICLSQSGQPNEATESFRRAIMISPYNPKAYYNMAVHQYSLGNKVEALEMAREAVKVDGRHTAARQLMTSIEGELSASVSPLGTRPNNPNDPLSDPIPTAPPVDNTGMPPGVGGAMTQPTGDLLPPPTQPEAPRPMAPPSQAPGPYGAPQAPQSPNPYGAPQGPQGYYRQGYEQSSEHSIAWIGNMGGAWTTIGWLVAVISLVGVAGIVILTIQAMGAMGPGGNPDLVRAQLEQSPGIMLIRVATLVSLVGGILFMVLDLVDRRGNFLWLIPQVICGCCGGTFLILPIYLLAGRK